MSQTWRRKSRKQAAPNADGAVAQKSGRPYPNKTLAEALKFQSMVRKRRSQPLDHHSMRPLRFLLGYLVVALVAAGLLLLNLWPWHPTSWRTWLLFVVLALPITIVGEWFGETALNNRLSKSVDRATASRSFSWVRIAYLLALVLLVLALLFFGQRIWLG
jgi:hypothetical protein